MAVATVTVGVARIVMFVATVSMIVPFVYVDVILHLIVLCCENIVVRSSSHKSELMFSFLSTFRIVIYM